MTVQTFGKWLLEYKGDNPVVQDLRDDYDSDYSVNFKRINRPHLESPKTFYFYIRWKGACPEALKAVEEAAILYGEPLEDEVNEA